MTKPSYDPKQPYHGLTGNHDSKIEAQVSFAFDNLRIVRCNSFDPPLYLTFKDGARYLCKPDFYHPKLDLYIEYKGHTLNSRTTPSTAKKALDRIVANKGFETNWDRLNCGFNHSKYKHAAIQKALTPARYIIVFDGPISEQDMIDYSKLGLVCIPLLALPTYLGFLRFRSRGLDVKFNLGHAENYSELKKYHIWLEGSRI